MDEQMDKRELQAIAGLYDAACIMHGEEELATVFDKGEAGEKFAADLIRRFNAFPALVEALEGLVKQIEWDDTSFLNEDAEEGEENALTIAREALDQAKA